ncbi:peptide chain release factor N(5)-glutamine methyltransferase [Virgibacillus oceani]
MTKQYEVLHRASLFLEKYNREPKVAEILLQHHLQVSRAAFYSMMQEPVPETMIKRLEADIKKHAETGVPLQHLTGTAAFYGRSFLVNENVLIPRMETEELVQHVIGEVNIIQSTDLKKTSTPLKVVDVGTGSGVIAISLKLELEDAVVFATDISTKALQIAKQNAQQLNADVRFLQGNFLDPCIKQNIKADVIVSNPPYIARKEKPLLADTVKDFDPEIALFADENGLFAYKIIMEQAKHIIKENGLLVFEIGHEQGEVVKQLVKHAYPQSTVNIIKDINGKDRIVSAKLAAE